MPRIPRRRRLSSSEERRIMCVLSALPRVGPEVTITPTDGEEHEVVFNPGNECSLPAVIGAQGFYVDYEALTRELSEATLVWYDRRVRVRHVWSLADCNCGGTWHDGQFHLCWHSEGFFHLTPGNIRSFTDKGALDAPQSRLLTPEVRVAWADAEECSGPERGGMLYAGHAVVQVAGYSFDCVRAIGVRPEEYDPDDFIRPVGVAADKPEPDGLWPEWVSLDDIYMTRDGRVVLKRRYISRDSYISDTRFHEWAGLDPLPDASEWSVGRDKVVYNDIEFRHWFDILTDVSLGWPAPSPVLANRQTRPI